MSSTSVTPSAASPAITMAAPARMSSARTGAAESRSTPRITAWWPSVRMSAPIRFNSSTNMNLLSKTFSVTMLVPDADDSSAIIWGWRSVGNPGYGSVTRSTHRARCSIETAIPSSVAKTSAPISASFDSTRSRWSARAPRSTTRPPVAHAAIANVPASTRSGITECSTGRNSRTPSIWIVGVPTPSIRAPIAIRRSARSESSGSRAAFSMTVVPRAATAAIRTFSVAPTLGKSRLTIAPRRPPVSASRTPCS